MSTRARRRWLAAALLLAAIASQPRTPAAAPQTSGDEAYVALEDAARAARARHELDAAQAAYQRMLDRAIGEPNALWQARGRLGLGRVATDRLQYAQAVPLLRQALADLERLGGPSDVGAACAALSIALGGSSPDESRALLARAIDAFDRAHDAPAKRHAQLLQIRATPGADVETSLAALVADARAAGDHAVEGGALHLWGDRLFNRGELDRSLQMLDAAAAALAGDVDPDELGTTYNSLGRLYRVHGQLTVALRYQRAALAIHERHGTDYAHIQSLNAVAATYQVLGDFPRARVYFERALARATRGGAPTIVAFLRASYGDLLVRMGEVARGRALLAQALDAALPYYRTIRGRQLAEADARLGDWAKASQEIDEAIAHCGDTTRVDCAGARIARARIALARGDLAAAAAEQQAVLGLIEAQHASLVTSDFMKQGFADLWVPTYSLAIDLQLRQGDVRGALETAELGRSRALLDLLASRDVPVSARTDTVAIAAGPAGLAPVASRRSVAVARAARVDDLVATAARLRSTLVIYWVGDGRIAVWTVAPDGDIHHAVTAVSPARLSALIRAATTAPQPVAATAGASGLVSRSGAQTLPIVTPARPVWRQLYDVLVQPVARYLPAASGSRITIVPHGPLAGVPFAALRDPSGRYLVERYATHVAPAGAFFDYSAPRASRPVSALLVANPADMPRIAGEAPLVRLPGAAAEVRAIAKLWPAGEATVLAGADATELRVLAAAPHQGVVHFATHAIVRDTNPSASFLALGRAGDARDAGELTPAKIEQLSLDADLVVLSACRSAGGPPTGDGIAALARAFISSGVPSVIATVWDVADAPTTRLLPAFYRAWLGGADKTSALRTAQLQLLADLRAGRVTVQTKLGTVVLPEDPMFWAGFV
ncbi:MAG TPA: CHAT domain-containing protein, partial [Polyangia bacterium]|nr:CHAT domain-containing protein [Polyangia bacterium]